MSTFHRLRLCLARVRYVSHLPSPVLCLLFSPLVLSHFVSSRGCSVLHRPGLNVSGWRRWTYRYHFRTRFARPQNDSPLGGLLGGRSNCVLHQIAIHSSWSIRLRCADGTNDREFCIHKCTVSSNFTSNAPTHRQMQITTTQRPRRASRVPSRHDSRERCLKWTDPQRARDVGIDSDGLVNHESSTGNPPGVAASVHDVEWSGFGEIATHDHDDG